MGKLPLDVRINIRDYFEKSKDESIDKLTAATYGIVFDFVVDFEAVHAKLDANNSYVKKIGEVAMWYLEGFVGNVAEKLEDEMIREEFLNILSKRKIVLEVVDKIEGGYFQVSITDGVLFISTKSDTFGTNCNEVGSTIVETLSKFAE